MERRILASYVCIMHMQSCRSNLDKIFRARMYRRPQQCDGTAASKQPVPAYRDITAKTCNTVPNPCKALETMPRTMVQQSSIAQTLQSQAEYSLIRVQMISLLLHFECANTLWRVGDYYCDAFIYCTNNLICTHVCKSGARITWI